MVKFSFFPSFLINIRAVEYEIRIQLRKNKQNRTHRRRKGSRIFNKGYDEAGTDEVWSEEKFVTVGEGKMLQTSLGDTTSLGGVSFTEQLWLQVQQKMKEVVLSTNYGFF